MVLGADDTFDILPYPQYERPNSQETEVIPMPEPLPDKPRIAGGFDFQAKQPDKPRFCSKILGKKPFCMIQVFQLLRRKSGAFAPEHMNPELSR